MLLRFGLWLFPALRLRSGEPLIAVGLLARITNPLDR